MRCISLASFAVAAIARLSAVFGAVRTITCDLIVMACTPVIKAVRTLFVRDFRHSISLPKLIAFRVTSLLKPVYRDSHRTDGRSLRGLPMLC